MRYWQQYLFVVLVLPGQTTRVVQADEQTAEDDTKAPEASAEDPETTNEPEATESPETTNEPEATEKPEATKKPQATKKPVAKTQKISLKISKKTYTADQFRDGKKTLRLGASAKTKLTYKVTKGSKYVSVNKSGLVTFKKGTPKGTYKISVTAKATAAYKKAAKTVTITVKAGKPVMSKVPMKWDLKNNKAVKYAACYSYFLYCNGGSIKVKNLKKVKSGKNYKVTVTLQWKRPVKFDTEFINEIGYTAGDEGYTTSEYYTVVDYQTGECLEIKNGYGVKVKSIGNWKYSNTKRHNGQDGAWFQEPKNVECSFSITYPKSYKNLCLIAGSCPKNAGKKFWKGKVTFDKSDLYSSGSKKVCHGMRIK